METAMESRRDAKARRTEEVLAAVIRLAEGPRCYATKRQIAAEAGLRCPETVKVYLGKLVDRGDLVRVEPSYEHARHHVILAHPQAREVLADPNARIVNPKPFLRVFAG